MTTRNQMAEQHILEHESRLKHIDELLERAKEGATETAEEEVSAQLKEIAQKRDEFARLIDELRLKSLDDWREEEIEKSGPMAVWDVIAQKLENLLERVER